MKQRLAPRPQARQGLFLLALLVATMWIVEAVNAVDGGRLGIGGGIVPRDVDRLWAIFTSPFLHTSFYPHLVDNTIPLVFMGVFVAWRGARRLALVTAIVIVVAGLGTWLISPARTDTIGASGLVFGYATYLFARGVFNRNAIEVVVGVVVGAVWGFALVSSLIPHAGISWQDHACGAVGGVLAAWLLAAPHRRARRGDSSGQGPTRRPPAPVGGHELHHALDRAIG